MKISIEEWTRSKSNNYLSPFCVLCIIRSSSNLPEQSGMVAAVFIIRMFCLNSDLSGCYKPGCFDSEHSEESYSLAFAHNVIPKQREESVCSKGFDRLKFNS